MERDARELEHISEILSRMFSEESVTEYGKRPEPPYDSPIETIFASYCFKHLRSGVHVEKQVEVTTRHGSFRIDFGLSVGDGRIGVECDGKDFHEGLRDELRDAILLGESHCATMYHFRGCDITCYPEDCVWLMSRLDPELFTERGHLQLERLHRLEISGSHEELAKCESFNHLIQDGTQGYHFWAFRRSMRMVSEFSHLRYYWKVLYDFACEHPGASLDELLDIHKSSWVF